MKFLRKYYSRCFVGKTSLRSSTLVGVALALTLCPAVVSAEVVISEFLYDAPGSDTDQEFVELFNAGTASVDLTKWKISDGSNHTFNVPPKNGGTGSITIAPGAYVLLVDNAPNFISLHSGITASVIDTVLSLPNAAGTISLIDDGGATVDSISYTKDQGAAGDGNSLTRASVGAATFAPAASTLGTGTLASSGNTNTGTGTGSNSTSTTSQTTQTTTSGSGSAPVASYVTPPEVKIFADGGDSRTVIVGADTEFDGRAYNRNQENVDHVRFIWNFGDGSTAEGPAVLHHYEYPGRYAVILNIAQDVYAASDTLVVTAEPARLAFSVLSDGSVGIENRAGRDLDLSHWIVRQSGRDFVLPDDSIILAGATMRISQKTLGFWSSSAAELDYPNGVTALRPGEGTSADTPAGDAAASPAPLGVPAQPVPVVSTAAVPRTYTRVPAEEDVAVPISDTSEPAVSVPDATSTTQVAASSMFSGSSRMGWLGALLIAGLAAGSAVVARRYGKREWNIVEET